MSENLFEEPPVDQDDTRPTMTVPKVEPGEKNKTSNRLFGFFLLLLALGLTAGAGIILLLPADSSESTPVTQPAVVQNPTNTAAPTLPLTPAGVINDPIGAMIEVYPTLDPQTALSLLEKPIEAPPQDFTRIARNLTDPFTIIPARERTEVIKHTVQQGETIESIAVRYGITPESIVWSNSRRVIQAIRPGDELNIPPVDGVYTTTSGATLSIRDYAERYKVDDPFIILDSPYNPQLAGLGPDDVPPNNTPIFIPGGEAEEVVWVANIEVSDSGDSGSSNSGSTGNTARPTQGPPMVSFARGEAGSCGSQPITGGTLWGNPLARGTYTITRGFSSYHSGIDLAAPIGTPVYAANGGSVIFAGWNSWGYGYMIALIHGPNMTVYAHLSEIYVSCGQYVDTGTIIGAVGNTGNSSGPHLHFEIRSGSNYEPYDPAATIGF
ncbi:MAG: hypothetical protein Kow00117_21110 [Phototrophicales bacterium]|nr:MAG: hypothetical protein CUN56_09185 [Phototrophicales bacterium]RMG76906.1 MAG: LysM peptidoglycan-binding domain-containing protein [Chloroflexota bacterium]